MTLPENPPSSTGKNSGRVMQEKQNREGTSTTATGHGGRGCGLGIKTLKVAEEAD
jgi:hypothetical protein